MKRILFIGLMLALMLTSFGGSYVQAAPGQTYTVLVGAEVVSKGVDIESYFPGTLHVHVGDSVLWQQNSNEIHTVSFLAGGAMPDLLIPVPPSGPGLMFNPLVAFPVAPVNGLYDGSTYANSGVMGHEPGQPTSFKLTFTKAGTYNYLCLVHGVMMSGKIVVDQASVKIPSPTQVSSFAKISIAKALAGAGPVFAEAYQQIKPDVKNPDGTTTHFVTIGFSKGNVDLMDFFPKHLEVEPGDKVVWSMSDMNMAPHTVTFLNGGPDIPLTVVVPQPSGPPFIEFNPAAVLPHNAGLPLTRNGVFNSGLLNPGPSSFEITIGNIQGPITYQCLLHDSSGMVATLMVEPK